MSNGATSEVHDAETEWSNHELSEDVRLGLKMWPFLRPQRRLLIITLLFLPLGTLSSLLQPYIMKHAIDAVVVHDDTRAWGWAMIAFAGAVIFEFCFRFAEMYTVQLAGQRSMAELRRAVFEHAERMRLSYFDRTPIGRILTRVTNDVDSLGELFSSGAVLAIADLMLIAGIVAFMFGTDAELAVVTLVALPPLFVVVEFLRRHARVAFRAIRARVAELNAYLSEQVQGMQVVQAFGREAASAKEYGDINRDYRDANHDAIRFDAWLYSIVEAVAVICVVLVLWYASQRSADATDAVMQIGTIFAFYQYIQLFFVPIRDLSQKYTILQSSLASAERIFGFLATDEIEGDELDADGSARAPSDAADPQAPAVRFDDVSFAYRRGDEVLHQVSFEVPRGRTLAVVGATGAGKSTIISLLLRLYEHGVGRIEVEGLDIGALPRSALRRRFALVPQDGFLFRGTVVENVAFGVEPDRERVRDVLGRVHALDLIERREGGIDATVDERGQNFSVGERQLIAFARALYRDAPILILDEATANVDSETEARLQSAVAEVMRGRTSIVIAHRLSTIREADSILVLHKGRVVEQGSNEELLARDGVYARLHRLQFGEG